MANRYFTQLTALTSGGVASGDALAIEDVDAAETKYITAANLRTYMTGSGSFFLGASGRLTLESGVPVSSTDQSNKTAIYLTPHNGNYMPLYDGSSFTLATFAELTLTLGATPHPTTSMFDVFFFDDSGTKRIGSGPAWTSTTARGTGAGTTELELYTGVYVNKNTITLKNGASTYADIAARQATYVGSFYTSAAGQTCDSLSRRLVFNNFSQVIRQVYTTEATGHTYTTGAWRAWNANTTVGQAKAEFICGLQRDGYTLSGAFSYTSVGSALNYLGVGINSVAASTVPTNTCYVFGTSLVYLSTSVGAGLGGYSLGYNYAQLIEYGTATSHTLESGALYINIPM